MSSRKSISDAPSTVLVRRRNPFALATTIVTGIAVVAVPVALLADRPEFAVIGGILALIALYTCAVSAWRWAESRSAPLAKNESVAFTTNARSDTASRGVVSVTNRRVYFEPATGLFVGGRGRDADGWTLETRALRTVRRGYSRGTPRLVLEATVPGTKERESHWLQVTDFEPLAAAVTKASGLRLEEE